MMEGSHTNNTIIVKVFMVGILGFRVEGFGYFMEVVIILGKEIGRYEETTT